MTLKKYATKKEPENGVIFLQNRHEKKRYSILSFHHAVTSARIITPSFHLFPSNISTA
jgi:hypothetical protein